MKTLNKRGGSNDHARALAPGLTSISYNDNSPASLKYGGLSYSSSCIACKNARCMLLPKKSVEYSDSDGFSSNTNQDVCPVGAIKRTVKSGYPVIDNEKCIHCGLCVALCPVGAIYRSAGKILINTKPHGKLLPATEADQSQSIKMAIAAKRKGHFIEPTASALRKVTAKLSEVDDHEGKKRGKEVRAYLVRNLLVLLEGKCFARRDGDVNSRIDAIYSNSNATGAVEMEFDKDFLSAGRRILDDVAIMHLNCGVNKGANHPLVVAEELPRNRQDYWQLVSDISKVLGIRIDTVTLSTLLILMWTRKKLKGHEHKFHLFVGNTDLRKAVKEITGIDPPDIPGAFTPVK